MLPEEGPRRAATQASTVGDTGPPDAHSDHRAALLDQDTLVARAQDADLDAFERLVDLNSAPIFRLAFRMLDDRGTAEEVVQDTFLQVWRKLDTLASPEAFTGWLYSIATRRCLDVIRTRQRRAEVLVDHEQMDATAAAPQRTSRDPQTAVEVAHALRNLDHLLQDLAPEQRACWLLREVHGLSYDDIALTVNVPASTVRGRIARARAFLAEQMDNWR